MPAQLPISPGTLRVPFLLQRHTECAYYFEHCLLSCPHPLLPRRLDHCVVLPAECQKGGRRSRILIRITWPQPVDELAEVSGFRTEREELREAVRQRFRRRRPLAIVHV